VHAFILSAGAINECLQQASAVAAWNDRTAIRDPFIHGIKFADEHVPLDVRDAYERLYGVNWEAQLRLPAGTSKHEAKARHGEWLSFRHSCYIAAHKKDVAPPRSSRSPEDWFRQHGKAA
jgi:hypothetical protein